MKFIPFFCLVICLFLGGCTSFKRMFSRPAGRPSSSHRQSENRRKNAVSRDPVMDMFKIRNKPEYLHDKDLSSQERALLNEQMHSNDSDVLVNSIRSDYKSKQKKRRDWVFGR